MRFHVLAADYDGTLAHHGTIDDATWAALCELRATGRKLVIVSGRDLGELLELLPDPDLFDRIVVENGGVLYTPSTKDIRVLAAPPPPRFVDALRARGVTPLHVGHTIVATWEPHEAAVLEVIRALGLELHVIFNKGAVMVLPSGVNKATGLAAALAELGLSPHDAIGVGDAENDHAMLEFCECGAAVGNALPALKARADVVLAGERGDGIVELVARVIADDLASVDLRRHRITIAHDGELELSIDPRRTAILVCGPSGSGKSTIATGIFERLARAQYQLAIVDPEGDYTTLDFAVALGAPKCEPTVAEALDVLREPSRNVVMNLVSVPFAQRPAMFARLWRGASELCASTGRPHWLAIDEVHHVLPERTPPVADLLPVPRAALYVTVHPRTVARSVLRTIDTMLVLGDDPEAALQEMCAVAGRAYPLHEPFGPVPPGHVLFWEIGSPPRLARFDRVKTERARHSRKYCEGNLGVDRSFYFRGPEGKLRLRAHNLELFVQLADGVDDDTWTFHLRNGDYSRWLRAEIKDAALADEVAAIERDRRLPAADSRAAIRAAVDTRYSVAVG